MILESTASAAASTTSTPPARTAFELPAIGLRLIGRFAMGFRRLQGNAIPHLRLLRLGTRQLGLRLRMRAAYNLLEVFLIFLLFEEIRDVEERVAFESDVDECRLHSRQHPGHAAFVNGSRERVLVLALKIDFGKLFVFYDRNFGFVRRS
jgi:hypothetical protein